MNNIKFARTTDADIEVELSPDLLHPGHSICEFRTMCINLYPVPKWYTVDLDGIRVAVPVESLEALKITIKHFDIKEAPVETVLHPIQMN